MINYWGVAGVLIMNLAVSIFNSSGISYEPKSWSADTMATPLRFGFGKSVSAEEIKKWDIDVRPDGKGLPNGRGFASEGEFLYQNKCAACHGVNGYEGPYDVLFENPTASGPRKQKVIGNYWPYATTLFDYIRRAMPYNEPGSLTSDEIYSLTAFIFSKSGLWKWEKELNASNLPTIKMPKQPQFVPDDRVDGPTVR